MKAPENISSSDSSSKCIVPTCGNSFRLQSSSYTGHSFPRDVTIRSEWMSALRSTESSILERDIDLDSAQICSDHFTPECFQQTEGQRNLLESAIPTLFGSADDGYVNVMFFCAQMVSYIQIFRKRSDPQAQQSPTTDKAKHCPIKAQEQMRKLIADVLKCTDGMDHPDNVKSTSTMFRLKSFPHVCRLCLKPKKSRQVLIPTDATDYEFDGDSIDEFLFDILPPGATLDKDKQHLLPTDVCKPCYELLKFFARYRSKIATVHRLMNALVELKHFNTRPIVELFNSKTNILRRVIKDLGLCRLNSYTVDDLIDEFPLYDLATFEGFVIKQENEEEAEEVPDQVEVICEEVKVELNDFPVDLGAIYAEECTAEEVKELTMDNVDVMLVEPKAIEKKTVVKKKRQRPVQKIDDGQPKKVRKLYGGRKGKELKKCEKCDYHTYYAKSFRSHQMTHERKENRVYRCKHPNCTEEFKTSAESYRHSTVKHKSHICETCGQACSTKYALASHMERHLKLYEYACTYCEKKKPTKRDLDFHIRRRHLNAVQYHCKTCAMVFNIKTTLDEHERTHGDAYDFHCTQCDKKFKRQKALARHIRKVHENFRVSCPHCDNTFSSAYNLNNHIECAHGIQTRFVCDICVLTLLSQEKLDLHRAQHLRPHELQCGTCLSVCMDQQQMADHLCITYRDDYFCCGRDHRYHYMYNKHMLVKHGMKTNARVKPVPGELVGRTRAQRKRVETCPKCEQVFATRTLKKQHMDICTGGADDTELQRTTGDIMMQFETS
ncbi:hypothetical protein RP20_CCG017183 [Aedes albopictus]|nr:hypothetical protein RP20_CCG017183 [Aedes albopictus]